jgi:hypothetical protein
MNQQRITKTNQPQGASDTQAIQAREIKESVNGCCTQKVKDTCCENTAKSSCCGEFDDSCGCQ